MKSTITKIFQYTIISLSVLFFTSCQDLGEDFNFVEGVKITKDSKVVSLMNDIAKSNANLALTKNGQNQQCARFLYPMTFKVFFGDNPTSTVTTINSDVELMDFLATLTGNTSFYINFPVSLIDANGIEIIVNSLVEFENAIQTAVDVCTGGGDDDGDNDDSDDDDNDNDDGDDDDDNDDGDDDDDSDDDDDNDDDDNDDDDNDDDDDDNDNDDDDDDDSDS